MMNGVVRLAKGNPKTVCLLLYGISLGSVALCIALWIRAKTIGEDERGNAERRALFVGLWPPMLWLMGDAVGRQERATFAQAGHVARKGGGSQRQAG